MFEYFKRNRYALISGALISLFVIFLQFSSSLAVKQLLERFDGMFYDLRLQATLEDRQRTDQPILIIDIDEKSLAAEGRWPWSRIKIGELVNQLANAGVAVVVFDVLFSEPERNPVDEISKHLEANNQEIPPYLTNLKSSLDADTIFSQSLDSTDVVLGVLFQNENQTSKGELPLTVISGTEDVDFKKLIRLSFPHYESNIHILQSQTTGSGFINSTPDKDGFIRKAALVAEHNGKFYPSIALEAARLLTFSETIEINVVDIGNNIKQISGVRWGNELIPTDAAGRVLIPYRGKRKSFPYISATDVLHNNVADGLLEGAVVFVGTSAVGLADLRATPVEVNYPGVEVHANVFEGLIHPEILPIQPDWWEAAVGIILIVLAIFCVCVFPVIGPLALTLTASVLIFLTTWFNFWLWQVHQISLMLTTSLLLILLLGIFNLGLGFFKENNQRKMIKGIFDQYVPPAHIDKMLSDPNSVNLDGERKEMTVLFSDIRSFTSISESLTASELKNLLNKYFNPITKSIFDHKGTIDKYVGDMVMAFWGAPLSDPDHAENALNAALDMQVITAKLREEFKEIGLPEIHVGIGLNTGDMSVGDMGSEYRRAYTVLGDAVNLGARLEGLTKFYGVECLVSESTMLLCPNHQFRFIDCVKVKGKNEPITIFEPLTEQQLQLPTFAEETEAYKSAYQHYLAQNWQQAKDDFTALLTHYSERKIYQVYLSRIAILEQETMSPDWDGVYTHMEK
ncbi:CHASE2 domain-containing protein [Colwellia echini]|uniref:Adenylate/guanylate cyclase domain-containing protein n=1 Tax=Colwellia echini TaxID=1982103 RepID=A0ABY3MYM4_9GAMM|nr:adenylate/guanylate cyclase domain-containing protein [Colwellia echini]TYK66284.1 adenylate/guanylate cyclase domain-containing protein [Colwellia echini]